MFCFLFIRKIDGWDVRDFTTSWRDGFAFNALIYSIRPELVDLRRVTRMEIRDRLENAFDVAERHLGIPRLIDVEGLFCSYLNLNSLFIIYPRC